MTIWEYSSDNGTNWAKIPANSGSYRECREVSEDVVTCTEYTTPALGGNRHTRLAVITKTSAATPATLSNGMSYTFKVRAVNGAGNGAASNAKTAVTIPLAPATFSVEAGDASAKLTWTKSASDATVTGWQFRQKKGSEQYGNWKPIVGSTSSTTEYDVTGLANGSTYTFQLRAVNAAGGGIASAEKTATPALSVPKKPVSFIASPGDELVMLQWDDPDNSSITKWQYTRDDGTTWTDICVTSSDSNCPKKTSYNVTGLTNGTSYSFKVRAVNDAGDGTQSNTATATPKDVPAQPTALSATAGNARVTLTWTPPTGDVTGWKVRVYRPRAQAAWRTITPTDGAGSTKTYTVTTMDGRSNNALANNVTYTFQVRAVNASGDGTPSEQVKAPPSPLSPTPPATSGLAARTEASSCAGTGWQGRGSSRGTTATRSAPAATRPGPRSPIRGSTPAPTPSTSPTAGATHTKFGPSTAWAAAARPPRPWPTPCPSRQPT